MDELDFMVLGFFAVVTGILMFGMFYTVDQTELAVVTRFGAFTEVSAPGIHVRIPIVDRILRYPVTQKNLDFIGPEKLVVLTSDGLDAAVELTMIYRIDDPERVYKEIGTNYDPWLISKVRSVARLIIANYTAEDLYTEARDLLEGSIISTTRGRVGELFVVEDILIRDVTLPSIVSEAIQNKMKALQESQQAQYELDRAKVNAQKRIVEAQAEAESIRIVRTELTKDYLTYEYIIQIANSENSKIYVVPQNVELLVGGVE